MSKYRLRIPAISQLWMTPIEAKNEDDALKKAVEKINSETIDYSDERAWEIKRCEDEDDEYHSQKCTCETCIQNYPERMIYLIDTEEL